MLWSLVLSALIATSSTPVALAGDNAPERPEAISLGLGGGLTLPQSSGRNSSLSFDTASARLRLSDGLTIEPLLSYYQMKDEYNRQGNNRSADKDTQTNTEAALNARLRLGDRGPVDLLCLMGVSYDKRVNEYNLDEGADQRHTTTVQNMSLDWGLGLEGFINPHWSVSADLNNPLFNVHNETSEDSEDKSSSNIQTLGVAFEPALRVQAHIYF